MLQWILTKLGTYLILRRIWNPIDFLGQRSRSVFTRMLCGKNLPQRPWPLTLKINRVPDSLKDEICTKLGQNPLKDVDPADFRPSVMKRKCKQWWSTIPPISTKQTITLTHWKKKNMTWNPCLRTKYVPSLVKIHWRMLILECSQGLWRTDGSVTISPRNFVGEGIIKSQ
jgi:hypothetical protein